MTVLLNSGSFIFGVIAWILPAYNLMRKNKANHKGWAALSIASVSACAVSLLLQLFEVNHRVGKQDWSALMDTSKAIAAVAGLLLAVTIILNTVVVLVYYRVSSGNRKSG